MCGHLTVDRALAPIPRPSTICCSFLLQVCGIETDNMQVHLHEEHGPDGPHREIRRGIGSAVVVHRLGWGGGDVGGQGGGSAQGDQAGHRLCSGGAQAGGGRGGAHVTDACMYPFTPAFL